MIRLIVLLSLVVGPWFIRKISPAETFSPVSHPVPSETALAFPNRSPPHAVDVPLPDRQVFGRLDIPHPITKLLQIENPFPGYSLDSNFAFLKFLFSIIFIQFMVALVNTFLLELLNTSVSNSRSLAYFHFAAPETEIYSRKILPSSADWGALVLLCYWLQGNCFLLLHAGLWGVNSSDRLDWFGL